MKKSEEIEAGGINIYVKVALQVYQNDIMDIVSLM